MPRLDDHGLRYMWNQPPMVCSNCGNSLRFNYCRQCDEYFFEGHQPGCALTTEHEQNQHRRYPTSPTELCYLCHSPINEGGWCGLCKMFTPNVVGYYNPAPHRLSEYNENVAIEAGYKAKTGREISDLNVKNWT